MGAATLETSSPAGEAAPVPPTMFGAYLARLRHKETRGSTALRTILVLAVAAGGVAAVKYQGERRYRAGVRDGQIGIGSADEEREP